MKIIVVVDVQNDFMTGPLGSTESAAALPHVIKRLHALNPYDYVFYTKDTHDVNYLDTPEGKKLPVPHCIRGTFGWEIPAQVWEITPSAEIIEKPTFGSPLLIERIKDVIHESGFSVEGIEIFGVCTDICVVSNALAIKAHFPDLPIAINAECCAGVTPELHEAALKVMASCQIDII